MNESKRLGGNFDSIFDKNELDVDIYENSPKQIFAEKNYLQVPINYLTSSSYQPRKDFNPDCLKELAESIKVHGVLQPIVVRKIGQELYEIIAGERRWRAAKIAGLDKVPIFIKEKMSNKEAMAIALIENIQRENLNPLEEAFALQKIIEEYQYTQEQVAESIGKSRATITNTLRLLNLENEVKKLLMDNLLDMGHARALLALEGESQIKAAHIILEKGLSVRQTETLVQNFDENKNRSNQFLYNKQKLDEWKFYLSQKLHSRASVQIGKNGKSSVVINFDSLDALERFIENVTISL